MMLTDESRPTRADVREDNRIVRGVVAMLGGAIAVLSALQAVFALGMLSQTVRGIEQGPLIDVVVRVVVNLIAISAAVALVGILRPERFPRRRRVVTTTLIASTVALLRCALQVAAAVYPPSALGAIAVEFVVGAVVIALVSSFAFLLVRATRRVRVKEREHARVVLHAVEAVQAVQQEELRVRREVAEGLHGRLQNALVVLSAELRAVASDPGEPSSGRIVGVADRLDDLREREIRAVSGALYPVDIEHGLVAAVRDLFARLPLEIAVDLDVDERYDEIEAQRIPVDQRVLLVRMIEEALTNALKHGGAREVRLRLGVEASVVVVGLDDDGRGVASGPVWSGLARLSRQFAAYGGSLELAPSPDLGGARLAGRLPLRA